MERAAQVSETGNRCVKPSELKSGAGGSAPTPQRVPKFPIDDNAEPPISLEEALAAGGANCPRHGGLIGQRGDHEGMVFLCLRCRMYWRYAKSDGPSRREIRYPIRALA